MKKHRRNPDRTSSTVVDAKAQEMTPAPKDKILHQSLRMVAGSSISAVSSERKTAQMKARSKVSTKTVGIFVACDSFCDRTKMIVNK